jgi:hypothetical protein
MTIHFHKKTENKRFFVIFAKIFKKTLTFAIGFIKRAKISHKEDLRTFAKMAKGVFVSNLRASYPFTLTLLPYF